MPMIYISAFMCVLRGKPIKIPTKIAASYVRYAKYISDVSYSQAETFSSTLLGAASGQMFTTGKPKLPMRVKLYSHSYAGVAKWSMSISLSKALGTKLQKSSKVCRKKLSITYWQMSKFQSGYVPYLKFQMNL